MQPFLSQRDRQLLRRQFRIREPLKLPGLVHELDANAKPQRILHGYDETPPGGRKAGYRPHIPCGFGHPHWNGFVVEMDDGRIALIGRQCARKHFGNEAVDHIEEQFEAEKDRQYQIRSLLAIRQRMPHALAELRALSAGEAVTGFDPYWQALTRKFGKLGLCLARAVRSSQGRLMASQRVHDEDATEEAAQAAARALAGEIRLSLYDEIEAAENPEKRRVAVARWKKFVARQPRKTKLIPLDMGPCEGWGLLNAAPQTNPARLVNDAIALASSLDVDRPTDRWTKADFAEMRSKLDAMFGKLGEAAQLVAELMRFAGRHNVARIADWARQIEEAEGAIGQDIRAEGRALIGKMRLELPTGYQWPPTPAIDALKAPADALELAA